MRRLFITSLIFFIAAASVAQPVQDKAQLEKERADLQEEIKAIERDLANAKKKTKVSLAEFNTLKKKINLQERYLNNINRELKMIDDDIYLSNVEIYRMGKQLDTLKAQYAKSVVYAYKNRSNYDYLNFIFSANSFNDAMKRISYLKQYRNYREQQVASIKETQVLIAERKKQQIARSETKKLAQKNQQDQVYELAKQKDEQAKVVAKLKSQEKDLLNQLNTRKKRDRDMKNAIAAVVKRLALEAKKKRDEELKNNPVSTNPVTTPVIVNKPAIAPAETKPAAASIEFNAGDVKLSGEFQTNKGRLPWPVDNGYVSIHFGKYEVPGLKGIIGNSSGITINTDNSGQSVKSIFDGEVVAIHDLGGASAVFVKHGKFLTSYGNLSSVSVSKGQKVSTGQSLGKNAVSDDGAGGQVDFMLLIENREQNPELWLRRR